MWPWACAQCLPLSWAILGAAAAALLFGYCYLALVPVNKYTDFTQVGYGRLEARGRSRDALARDCMRTRRVGKLRPLYANGWCPVLESSKIANGQVRLLSVLGENMAVFRGTSGEVHVLDAYCPHLGANMAIGGKVRGDCLECPFHAWTYSGFDGRCTSIPNSETVPDSARVRRWPSAEVNGFVLVWYHAEGALPSWDLEPLPHLRSSSYIGRLEYTVQCHAQDIFENGIDVAHFNVVHGSSLGGLEEHDWRVSSMQLCTEEGQTHRSRSVFGASTVLLGCVRLPHSNMSANQEGPYYVHFLAETEYGPISIIHTVSPIGPLLQRIVQHWYAPKRIKVYMRLRLHWNDMVYGDQWRWRARCFVLNVVHTGRHNTEFKLIREDTLLGTIDLCPRISVCLRASVLSRMTFLQNFESTIQWDMPIWNHKMFVDKPILVKADKFIVSYRRWYSQFYSENSPRYSNQNNFNW